MTERSKLIEEMARAMVLQQHAVIIGKDAAYESVERLIEQHPGAWENSKNLATAAADVLLARVAHEIGILTRPDCETIAHGEPWKAYIKSRDDAERRIRALMEE